MKTTFAALASPGATYGECLWTVYFNPVGDSFFMLIGGVNPAIGAERVTTFHTDNYEKALTRLGEIERFHRFGEVAPREQLW